MTTHHSHQLGLLSVAVAASMLLAPTGTVQAQRPDRGLRWRQILEQPRDWYGSDEAVRIADNVLASQHPNGGWGKNVERTRVLSDEEKQQLRDTRSQIETTIDNRATHTEIRFLARVHAATGDQQYVEPINRGLEYLLAAQYDNGGWPQFYPIKRGYYEHITFNDGAMIGVMNVLRDVAEGERPFEFVDDDLRARARQAIDKGLAVILKCQVMVDGRPTAWCAQHDHVTFEPRPARAYELVSLSGMESVEVVEYLMKIDDPSPEVKQAIEGAVAWFEEAKIEGLSVHWVRDAALPRGIDRVAEPDPSASPRTARCS
jgi:PelA/Pel-15E family pectate lyase